MTVAKVILSALIAEVKAYTLQHCKRQSKWLNTLKQDMTSKIV